MSLSPQIKRLVEQFAHALGMTCEVDEVEVRLEWMCPKCGPASKRGVALRHDRLFGIADTDAALEAFFSEARTHCLKPHVHAT